jgi:pyruvate,water dikinase
MRLARRLKQAQKQFSQRFREQIIPDFINKVAQGASEDLCAVPSPVLLEKLEHWIRLTLYEFARDSLKPTLLAAHLVGDLEKSLAKSLGQTRSQTAVRDLSMGARPDADADLPGGIQELATGKMDRSAFLKKFGHRGRCEMELASPRWSEEPAALDRLIQNQLRTQEPKVPDVSASCGRIAVEAKWTGRGREKLQRSVEALHTLLGQRETAKHYWMQGYAQIRRVLVELDRRFELGGGIFYLMSEELPRLVAGENLAGRIRDRRRRRALTLSLEVPLVLFSDDLEAIGRPLVWAGADMLRGTSLSVGAAEGVALVIQDPDDAQVPTEPYILVCPSTDPAWVPLFVHARGLVMETGGVLSHGAIVAREFGLPAVAGLPGIHRRLRTGQRLRVDGTTGTVTVLSR